MSALRTELAAQLARYDDEAFAALANRGLLRRAGKDLEKQAATIVEESADALVMAFGEHRIRFDARGPTQASCSCPASGMCQHILAAALTLQREAASPAAESTPATANTAADEDPLAGLHDELAALDAATLQRHAGKAGYRWAWQFVQDLPGNRDIRVGGERHLVLAFEHPRLEFRYMGGGLDGLVADVDLPQVAKYRVAAVLAWRRQRGLAIDAAEPAARAKATTAALDLGLDHQLAQGGDLRDSRTRLREAARRLLAECVDLGLSHLSRGIHERFATLAVWTQGAELPRLALLLRRVADHVELLLERAGAADEHRLLDEMALASGLVDALAASDANGAAPAHLVGRARTRYEGAGALDLLGLGAHAWRSPTGFCGLTMLFWSPADRAFMSCTDARPQNLRGFDPVARYQVAGPWAGLGAPAQATGRRIRLTGAQLNHQGRLSAAEATSAAVEPPAGLETFRTAMPVATSWPELVASLGAARQSLLADARPMLDWVVLEPTRFGSATFDATRQVLTWPLHDRANHRVDAELAWSPTARHAIARIEQLGPADLAPGTRVVARMIGRMPRALADGESTAPLLTLEPLSLIRAVAAPGQPAVDALFFDPPTQGAPKTAARADPDIGTALVTPRAAPAVDALPRPVRALREWLRAQAERGVGEGRAAQLAPAFRQHARQCEDAGLATLAAVLLGFERGQAAAVLLRANYLCLQLERLILGATADAD